MSTTIFQEIDNLHSELEKMSKSAKLAWLAGQKMRLNRLARQFAQYLSLRGGFANDNERDYANRLLEMINMVNTEGAKAANDLAKDAFMDMLKTLMR